MCICLNVGDKRDLQIMQNDALRYCYNVRLADRVIIVDLHARAKISSLEQRRISSCWDCNIYCIKRTQIDM